MIQQKIKRFLAEQHYLSGVEALRLAGVKYSSDFDSILISNRHIGERDLERLHRALIPLINEEEQEAIEVGALIQKVQKVAEPDAVRTLRVQGGKAYDQLETLKQQLLQAETDEDRYQIAEQIMNLSERIDDIYARIRTWTEKGEIPFVLNTVAQQVIDMMKRMKTLESRISRLKKNNTAAARTELKDKTAELLEIKTKLNL